MKKTKELLLLVASWTQLIIWCSMRRWMFCCSDVFKRTSWPDWFVVFVGKKRPRVVQCCTAAGSHKMPLCGSTWLQGPVVAQWCILQLPAQVTSAFQIFHDRMEQQRNQHGTVQLYRFFTRVPACLFRATGSNVPVDINSWNWHCKPLIICMFITI